MLGSVPASVATSRLTGLCLEESRLGGLPRCGCPCGRSARVEAGEPVSGQTMQLVTFGQPLLPLHSRVNVGNLLAFRNVLL